MPNNRREGDFWSKLRRFTQAQIGLGSSGPAFPTSYLLKFQLAHAIAKDSVHHRWNAEQFRKSLKKVGLKNLTSLTLASQVKDRMNYLARPDLGRKLDSASLKTIKRALKPKKTPIDITFIVSNGLSTLSIDQHGLPLLSKLTKRIVREGWTISPVFLVPNARVAISDQIGEQTKSRIALIIIGERPGLSSCDSLAIYLTFGPKLGNTDANRNCISNIRPPDGLSYHLAIEKCVYLIRESLRLGYSGVMLKDGTDHQRLT